VLSAPWAYQYSPGAAVTVTAHAGVVLDVAALTEQLMYRVFPLRLYSPQ
jgi:hypothetical protein